jgi:ribosome-associated toxin RatA of RatAB toxin-antitoxin module
VIAFGTGLAITSLFSQPLDTDWIDDALIEGGDTQIDFGDDRGFRGLVRAAAVIDAPAETVWAILIDCESAPDYLETVLSCELIDTSDDGLARIFRQRVKLRWFLPTVEHEFRLDSEPYERIDVNRVSGPFEQLSGSWWLREESRGRTRVIYRLELDPGPLIPNFLLTRALRRDIVDAFRMVQERARIDQSSD